GRGIRVEPADVGEVDASIWLEDASSVLPRPDPTIGVRAGGDVLIQASIDSIELLPVVVEVDRVALVSGVGEDARRIEIIDDEVSVREIVPWPLVELDQALANRGFELHRRSVDWSGVAVTPGTPCHLSWFRNIRSEPR
ncbi:MAG: hypothetical protein P8N02_15710, partial [Actinomycetota bacterium]|nr:hypothetical protein [Actinomycetota bacterium]